MKQSEPTPLEVPADRDATDPNVTDPNVTDPNASDPNATVEYLLTVGRFRACSVLGEGGQGVVYRGEHVDLGYPVAIKVLHADSASAITRARFRREARLGAQVQHANVVRVIELGELEDGSPYLVMEHIDGVALASLLSDRMLSVDATVELGVQLLAALTALHAKGILHRDIKPENIMIARGVDGSVTAKILDFGISKTNDKELEPATLTRAGMIVGTPSYMSPEHVRGEPLDVRSDLYAVAGVLYETISGHPPHSAPTTSAVFAKIVTEPVPSLRSLAPSCPSVLAEVIDRGLRRDRDERWEHPLAMSEALRAAAHRLGLARGADAWTDALDGPEPFGAIALTRPRRDSAANAPTETASPAPRVRPPWRRRMPWVAASAVVVLAAAAWVGALLSIPSVEAPMLEAHAMPEIPVAVMATVSEPAPPARSGEEAPVELDLDALEREARLAFVRGDGHRSLGLYRRVLEQSDERASAWRGLGLVALAYGENREARRALERYLALAPDARDRRRIERELRGLR